MSTFSIDNELIMEANPSNTDISNQYKDSPYTSCHTFFCEAEQTTETEEISNENETCELSHDEEAPILAEDSEVRLVSENLSQKEDKAYAEVSLDRVCISLLQLSREPSEMEFSNRVKQSDATIKTAKKELQQSIEDVNTNESTSCSEAKSQAKVSNAAEKILKAEKENDLCESNCDSNEEHWNEKLQQEQNKLQLLETKLETISQEQKKERLELEKYWLQQLQQEKEKVKTLLMEKQQQNLEEAKQLQKHFVEEQQQATENNKWLDLKTKTSWLQISDISLETTSRSTAPVLGENIQNSFVQLQLENQFIKSRYDEEKAAIDKCKIEKLKKDFWFLPNKYAVEEMEDHDKIWIEQLKRERAKYIDLKMENEELLERCRTFEKAKLEIQEEFAKHLKELEEKHAELVVEHQLLQRSATEKIRRKNKKCAKLHKKIKAMTNAMELEEEVKVCCSEPMIYDRSGMLDEASQTNVNIRDISSRRGKESGKYVSKMIAVFERIAQQQDKRDF